MFPDDNRLKELDAQIKLKLSEGKIEEAERLSTKLIEYAENSQFQNTAVSMVSKLFNSVVAKLPGTPTPEQIAQIKEATINEEHLRQLSLFHYLNAGITALISSMFLIYMGFGTLMLLNPHGFTNATTDASSVGTTGWVFFLIGLIPLVIGWSYSALNVAAGRFIRLRKRRNLCLFVSGLNVLNAPFGSILGISTFLVLSKPQVQSLFQSSK